MRGLTLFCILLTICSELNADTGAFCLKQDILGDWDFAIGIVEDLFVNCSKKNVEDISVLETARVSLIEPNLANVAFKNGTILTGTWTMIDVEGLDIYVGGLHDTLLFNTSCFWNNTGHFCDTDCSNPWPGWLRQDIVSPPSFSCFYGKKIDSTNAVLHHTTTLNPLWTNDKLPINKEAWQCSEKDFSAIARGRKFIPTNPEDIKKRREDFTPQDIRSNMNEEERRKMREKYPANLDWSDPTKNEFGIDFVSPVYNQASCGCCFAYGTLGSIESRFLLRSIALSRGSAPIDISLAVQDVVSCGLYTQGCDGGWPQILGGWMKDHGVVVNKCFPYAPNPREIKCDWKCSENGKFGINQNGRKYFVQNMQYVGGFLGNCTEEAMLDALQGGPIAVSLFSGDPSFQNTHCGQIVDSDDNTTHIDHTVVLAGYGIDEVTGTPYWKIKNSWGPNWGCNGYALIRRGRNTIAIESEAELFEPYMGVEFNNNREDKEG